jgi:hypothetical protein
LVQLDSLGAAEYPPPGPLEFIIALESTTTNDKPSKKFLMYSLFIIVTKFNNFNEFSFQQIKILHESDNFIH